jgi:hypothetical protein
MSQNNTQPERILLAWYRQRLKEEIIPLMAKWEAIIGVKVAEWGVSDLPEDARSPAGGEVA